VSPAESSFRQPWWASDYTKHHPPRPSESWDDVVRETGRHEGIARYHPDLSLVEIERMEIDTVTEAMGLGHEIESKRKHNKRVYWRRMDRIIGASNGQETQYLYVEYGITGNVHGRPMTVEQLKSKGARV
jgi:hypothetical protein